MDLTAISIQQLRYLDAVSDGTTFGDAADELYVSQSALSQGLARLEELVGAPLFEPDGRLRRLTAAGELVAETARTVIGETDRLAGTLDERSAGSSGTLRIGMIDAAALYLFDDAIAAFRADRPDVDVRITVKGSDNCLERLAEFEDDVSIVVGPADGFATTTVATEPFHLFGPQGSPSADSSWMLYPTGSHTRALIDGGLRDLGMAPEAVAESGNPDVLRQLAVLNAAFTVLPASVAEGGGLHRSVVVVDRPIVAARREGSPPNPLVEAFLEAL